MRMILISLLLSFSAIAKDYNLIMSSSPLPKKGEPYSIAIDKNIKSTDIKMRVKVYPHTLSNDYAHGKPDNGTSFSMRSNDAFTIIDDTNHEFLVSNINLRLRGNLIHITDKSGIITKTTTLRIPNADNHIIQLVRPTHEEKYWHRYYGSFRLFIRRGKIEVVNKVSMLNYLKGVVPSESLHWWPMESLKAQSLAARSYAFYHYSKTSNEPNWNVDDTARYQVYTGLTNAKPTTDQAVEETQGEILTHNGKVITAFFQAYSGGYLDSAKRIFGNHVPYCVEGEEIFQKDELRAELNPSAHWIIDWTTKTFTKSEMMNKLKSSSKTRARFTSFSARSDFNVSVSKINERTNYLDELTITQGRNVSKVTMGDIKSALGWNIFKSYHFNLPKSSELKFKGSGWGHNVGMSQWGAFIMAKNYGMSYKDILFHYYKNVQIEKI